MIRYIAFLTLCFTSSLMAETLSLDTIMNDEERTESGIDKLEPQEKKQLESFLVEWTRKVIQRSATYRPGESIPNWVQNWDKPLPESTIRAKDELDKRFFIKIAEKGKLIILDDNTVWETAPFSTHIARTWKQKDQIIIKPSKNVNRPFWLENVTQNQKLEAKKTDQKYDETDENTRSSIKLLDVSRLGDSVQLIDKSIWKVRPEDQEYVQKWSRSDRIVVTQKKKDYYYPYTLENLDTGDIIFARPKDTQSSVRK